MPPVTEHNHYGATPAQDRQPQRHSQPSPHFNIPNSYHPTSHKQPPGGLSTTGCIAVQVTLFTLEYLFSFAIAAVVTIGFLATPQTVIIALVLCWIMFVMWTLWERSKLHG
ncbi:hypothetical protein DFJ77DRAFT_471207 [Powellomyces hirtus]|nr:hypothetical protein DFJ77DRAFT_471207 [Powellomyces hirtus]